MLLCQNQNVLADEEVMLSLDGKYVTLAKDQNNRYRYLFYYGTDSRVDDELLHKTKIAEMSLPQIIDTTENDQQFPFFSIGERSYDSQEAKKLFSGITSSLALLEEKNSNQEVFLKKINK